MVLVGQLALEDTSWVYIHRHVHPRNLLCYTLDTGILVLESARSFLVRIFSIVYLRQGSREVYCM